MSSGVRTKMASNVSEILKKLGDAKEERLIAASEHARNRLVEKLGGNRTGRTYTVPGTSVTYTASSPGEAPASRTGQLRGSIEYETTKDKSVIGTRLQYGAFLELGTNRNAPRPWLRSTLLEERDTIKKILGVDWL